MDSPPYLPSSPYWCYQCLRMVAAASDDVVVCPQCNDGFIQLWTPPISHPSVRAGSLQLKAFRKDNRAMLPRKELFKNTLRKAAYAWKRIVDLRLTEQEASKLRFFVDEPAYTDLHWGMFVPAIKGQGTDEQQSKWLSLAYKMQIIGCYA